jgi:hypothetical protein
MIKKIIKNMLLIILFLIFVIIIIYNSLKKNQIRITQDLEKFKNKYYSDFDIQSETNIESENNDYKCNSFFNKNSFCNVEFESNKCDCKFQKDNLRYIFDSPETCCKRVCNDIKSNKCVKTTPYTHTTYYCRVGDECKEFNGTIENSKISSNYCGNDPLNNQLLIPFAYKEECEKTIDPCDKYNIPGRSFNVNRTECLKDVNCGYCANNTGGGKCISGTTSGPSNLIKYFYCDPASIDKTFSYTYGNHVSYLLQS